VNLYVVYLASSHSQQATGNGNGESRNKDHGTRRRYLKKISYHFKKTESLRGKFILNNVI